VIPFYSWSANRRDVVAIASQFANLVADGEFEDADKMAGLAWQAIEGRLLYVCHPRPGYCAVFTQMAKQCRNLAVEGELCGTHRKKLQATSGSGGGGCESCGGGCE